MATNKSKLARDPNIPDDDASLARKFGQGTNVVARTAGAALRQLPTQMSEAYQAPGRAVINGAREFYSGLTDDDPTLTEAPRAVPVKATPIARDPISDEQRAKDVTYGDNAGRGAIGYLRERKSLAPGVRRLSGLADPAEVYMAVDKNGNRVYTDDAKFAAGMSNGRALTRRDFAPGVTDAEANATLDDPEGGFTYAPASASALKSLREASNYTHGGSKRIEQALGEAEKAQAIADTKAGTRDIDKRRAKQASEQRQMLGLPTTGDKGLSLRDLLALQANDRAERQLSHQVENDNTDNALAKTKDERDTTSFLSDQLKRVRAGELDPGELQPLIATLPPKQAEKATYQLRRNLLQRYLTQQAPWFLGADEVQYAEPSSIRQNKDGSGTYAEPDSGLFDIQRNINLSPEEMAQIYGDPENQDAARERELNIRLRRGL